MNYRNAAASLTESLSLAQPPVALCLMENLPEGLSHYEGQAPAGCAFWQRGATQAFVTSPQDHSLCAVGVYTHNLEPGPGQESELGTALQVFAELGYVRPADIPLIPVLQARPRYVVYAPLEDAPAEPDVVLLLLRAADALIVAEACQQVEGGSPPAMGRPACAVVPQVVNTGRAAYSLGCCGARAYLDVFSDVNGIFAIPGRNLDAYLDRIAALAKANQTLAMFHQLRRRDVEAGQRPTIAESLATVQQAAAQNAAAREPRA